MTRGCVSEQSAQFTEWGIREMTRMCLALHGENCLNLAQGFPDFAAPAELKEAAVEAIRADFNQYATTWGAKPMRDAIADKTRHFRGMAIDPETEITVCCGVTEAVISTALAVLDPGDEVIIFEPFYETYSVTGWRLAYAIAPPAITNAVRKVHDFVTVGAPHPLQVAAATALRFPDTYYVDLLAGYRERRDFILEILQGAGFLAYPPDGAD